MITVAFLGRECPTSSWLTSVVVHLLWTSIFIVILEMNEMANLGERKYVLERHQRLTKSIETVNSDSSNQPVGTGANFHGGCEERSPSWHAGAAREGVLSWLSTAPGPCPLCTGSGLEGLFQIPREPWAHWICLLTKTTFSGEDVIPERQLKNC